jgi:hypothetical protein
VCIGIVILVCLLKCQLLLAALLIIQRVEPKFRASSKGQLRLPTVSKKMSN